MFERQDTVIGCINAQVVNSHEYLFSFQMTMLILLEDFLQPACSFCMDNVTMLRNTQLLKKNKKSIFFVLAYAKSFSNAHLSFLVKLLSVSLLTTGKKCWSSC